MGVHLKELTIREPIAIESLAHKILVVDGYNILYQFLTTIRGPDGSPLTDAKGKVTSHLIGLFSRSTKLMQSNIKLVFVFDGVPPDLKRAVLEERKATKIAAQKSYEEAKAAEDVEAMKKFSGRTARLTKDLVEEAKLVCSLLGIPTVQAPSEGEAQMAYMVKKGDAWAGVSQDYDSLLYGCPRLIQNLSIAGKRKLPGSPRYVNISPELVNLKATLEHLKFSDDQLLALAMLVGTDYNPGGIKGIGPKKALKLVTEHGKNIEALFVAVKFNEISPHPWKEIWDTFKKMPVTDDYKLQWKSPDTKGLIDYLVRQRDFSEERVLSALENLKSAQKQQKSLGDFG